MAIVSCFWIAAQARKSPCVIEAESALYAKDYANIHRGVYELSQRASEKYSKTVQRFLNARYEDEIVFRAARRNHLICLYQAGATRSLKKATKSS